MAVKKVKLTSQTAWETQKDLNDNFADLEDRLDGLDIPEKTSDLTNDGDGLSPFATEDYVDQNGGKIDSISVNGTPQTIDANKNVDITVPVDADDVGALPDTTKYGASILMTINSSKTKMETTWEQPKQLTCLWKALLLVVLMTVQPEKLCLHLKVVQPLDLVSQTL